MVFGSIGSLIDKIKALVVEYFDGITKQVNDTIEIIRKDIGGVAKKLDEVKDAVNANNVSDRISELKQGSDGVQGEIGAVKETLGNRFDAADEKLMTVGDRISELKQGVERIESGISDGVQGEIGTVKETLGNRFDAVDEKLTTLTTNFNKLFDEQAAELERLRAEAAQVEVLKTQAADKDKEISNLSADLNFSKEKSDGLSKELESVAGKLIEAQKELETERQDSAAAKEALKVWREAVADYVPVRDALKNCSVFGKLLEECGLTDETDIGLFAFVQELGKTMDFLSYIHAAALDAKKSQPQLMSKEELAVYEALNRCYRCIWKIDFDVFVTPGERKPIGDAFYKIPFSKDDAVVLKDPRNRSMKFVKGIYVPLLLNREGKMYKQAYVEAVTF